MVRAKRHRRVPAELKEASGGLMQPSWETERGGRQEEVWSCELQFGKAIRDQNQSEDAEKEGCCQPLEPRITKGF